VKRLLWGFLGTTVLGVLISLAAVDIVSPSVEPVPSSTASVELDKQYVDQFADRIKWLETLAYAALAGVVGLRWSRENLVNHVMVAFASGCLAVSLFNGYRAHDEILQALQLHTPLLLASKASRLIVVFQFWFLAIAIAVLAVRVLSVPLGRHHKAASAAILLLFLTSLHVSGQVTTKSDAASVQKDCAKQWVVSHYERTPTPAELNTLVTIVAGTAKEKKLGLDSQSGCAFSASILDYVANGSYNLDGDRDYADFLDFAGDVARAISSLGLSDSPFVRALWSAAEIWHQARGVLRVQSAMAGDEVFVDGTERGLTAFTCAIAPGKHQPRILVVKPLNSQKSLMRGCDILEGARMTTLTSSPTHVCQRRARRHTCGDRVPSACNLCSTQPTAIRSIARGGGRVPLSAGQESNTHFRPDIIQSLLETQAGRIHGPLLNSSGKTTWTGSRRGS
jgi:hypothetical protein